MQIAHTGSTSLKLPSKSFHLKNVLHVPNASKNLISISQFCDTNQCSLEFFPNSFLVKDLHTRTPLAQGLNKDGVYEFPQSAPLLQPPALASVGIKTTSSIWHQRLGHPSSAVLQQVLRNSSLPCSSSLNFSSCNSCNCNKSHRLPFSISSLSSKGPLELIYTDVSGPAPIFSIDGFKYYVSFVDHFTRYTWLYPIKNKSDVSLLFPKFKALVENYFKTSIVSIFSDCGGEFAFLHKLFTSLGIQHLQTPPHTPQHNAIVERRHRSIVETSLTLLHQASMPYAYWSYAFRTAVYLLNRLPTPVFHNDCPFQKLFHQEPNYSKLKVFSSVCYPWLKPYTPHKLAPKSKPCVFLGYSNHQSAYLCLDIDNGRIYTSRHVLFVENQFPFLNKTKVSSNIPSTETSTWTPALDFPIQSPILETKTDNPNPTPILQTSPRCSSSASDISSNIQTSAPRQQVVSSHANPTSSSQVSNPIPDSLVRVHPMTTRSQNNIFKPKQLHSVTKHPLPEATQPTCATQAVKLPHWNQAMKEELAP